MITFLEEEKNLLAKYARETWLVLTGKYAMTEMNGMEYHVRIGEDRVVISPLQSHTGTFSVPTIQFKAFLEMFRCWD